MTYILLTGAGFSRNWGGWFASEAFEYILSDKDLTVPMRTQLWKDKLTNGNFEDTIQAFRDAAKRHGDAFHQEQYSQFNSIIAGMFNAMKNAFIATGFKFEFQKSDANLNVSVFLQRFDTIFTLNQDTLLEAHYLNSEIAQLGRGKWNGWQIPGLEDPKFDVERGSLMERTSPRIAKQSGFTLSGKREQPYYKLHGSHNWLASPTSGLMLIMGGNKATDINESPLLAWYSTKFREAVVNSHARLMIIGYSFSDRHINEVLLEAAGAGAKFYIVDIQGVDAFDKRQSQDNITYNLRDRLIPHVIGASRRPLSSTFSFDRVEHSKLTAFFNS